MSAVAVCGLACGQYGAPTVQVPTYGAGLGQAQPGEPPWVKRLEDQLKSVKDDVAYIRKELDDTAEAKAGAPAANGGELAFRQLSADDSGAVRRKVIQGKMPPKGEPPLAPEEKTALLAAMEGKEFDPKAFSDAGGKCVKCHAPGSPPDAGGGFVMFQAKSTK
jgi:hypothetical protein